MAVLTVTFQSQTLFRSTTFSAVIPTSTKSIYDPDKGVADTPGPLKTLYLLHGWDGSQDDWIHYTRIVELATKYNIAVIMPAGENSFYVDHPGTNQYGAFITDELVEETRRLFHLSDKAEDTWIAGLSMGGYGALRNGLKTPGRFGKIASFSGAVLERTEDKLSDQGPDKQLKMIIGSDSCLDTPDHMDIHWLAGQVVHAPNRPEVYMTCGTEDFLIEDNRSLHRRLESLGWEHTYTEYPGGHDWDYWNHTLEEALIWLTGAEE